ncbi:MAG: helix-turn-helix domain-containing protein [Candidatus Methanospirareceae archaeon]
MEEVLTVLEAARIFGVHPESVKRWIRYGELDAEKQGILYLIKRRDLDSFRLLRRELEDLKRRDYREYWETPQGTFVERIGDQLDGLLDDQPMCVIALEPGGVLYAEHLARYLAVIKCRNPTLLRLPGAGGDAHELEERVRTGKEKLSGRKLLLVDDDTCTGDTYKTVTEIIFKLEGELEFVDFFKGEDLAEYFEIIVAPFLTGHVDDLELIQTARRIPLAVYTDTIAIASFFVRRIRKG